MAIIDVGVQSSIHSNSCCGRVQGSAYSGGKMLGRDSLVQSFPQTLAIRHASTIFSSMPPRPFPYQLSIGTDIVHVRRIRSILAKADGDQPHLMRFLRRFLTPREQEDFLKPYWGTKNAATSPLDVASRHLAGRYVSNASSAWRILHKPHILGCIP